MVQGTKGDLIKDWGDGIKLSDGSSSLTPQPLMMLKPIMKFLVKVEMISFMVMQEETGLW